MIFTTDDGVINILMTDEMCAVVRNTDLAFIIHDTEGCRFHLGKETNIEDVVF